MESWGGGLNGHVFDQISSLENLILAWGEFKRGKRSKLDVKKFEFFLEDELFSLRTDLCTKKYSHEAYTPFYVTDPKLRHIHKATVRDRVLHQAIFRVLYPIFDPSFIFDSYACRVNKGTHRGVDRLEELARKLSHNNSRTIFSLKCDVKKFFDSIDHSILRNLIERKISDPDVLWLVQVILDSYATTPGRGLPLGNVTSQLFANIYLHELDQFAKQTLKLKYYVRYCDDFIVLTDNHTDLHTLKERFADFLDTTLHLTLHPHKIVIRTYRQGIDFLGYVVRPHCRTVRTTTKKRILRKAEQLRSLVGQGELEPETFHQALQSYIGILDHCDGHTIACELEKRT